MYTTFEKKCISQIQQSADHSQYSSHRASSTLSLAVSCGYATIQSRAQFVSTSLCILSTQRMEAYNA
jgi:hypothetical protein